MASILEEFAYGTISTDAHFFKKDPEYNQALEFAARHEEKLLERLSSEDKVVFENYVGTQREVNQLAAVKNLVYGFRLGMMMTAETFIGMDDLYLNGNQSE